MFLCVNLCYDGRHSSTFPIVFKPGLDIRILKLWYDSFEEKSINQSINDNKNEYF